VTSQGTAHGRFTRAIQTRNLWAAAETAMRELTAVSLVHALDYLALLAAARPDRFDCAAVRWHGRLEAEASTLTLVESQLALAALGSLGAGDPDAAAVLQSEASWGQVRRWGSSGGTKRVQSCARSPLFTCLKQVNC